jgi:hypothetical protein
MSAPGQDATFSLAGDIVARSWIARRIDSLLAGAAAAATRSRILAIARKPIGNLQHMPARERAVCLLLLMTAAVSGHVVLASMLPASARPAIALTALLLAAGLAGGAAIRWRRQTSAP